MTPGDIRAYREGEIGWAVDRPSFVLPDGTETKFRFTVVFRKEAGSWKMVHGHASVGVANEAVIGRELTV